MQEVRTRLNDDGVLQDILGVPEPFDAEKMMRKLDEPDVKEVQVFKATTKELDRRINLLAKGQRRKVRKAWKKHREKVLQYEKANNS